MFIKKMVVHKRWRYAMLEGRGFVVTTRVKK